MKLLFIVGARPNFMKIAPLIHVIRGRKGTGIEYKLVHTGQHYDEKMSDVFFRELGIPAPDVNLGVGSGSHAKQTAAIMTSFEPVCMAEKPDFLVVVGDVNSTLACALVATKAGIKVAHVEAGLRSYDRTMPEEINRVVTDAVSDLLLTPSEDADENLKKEGVAASRIRLVGNIMIDALVSNMPRVRESGITRRLGIADREFVYVTLHRPSNVDNPKDLLKIASELENIAARLPVVFPIHPRTRKQLEQAGFLVAKSKIKLLEPIGYHDSLRLTEGARVVITDSGGLQEEATYFRTPCLTLRPNTERPITITVGSNQLTSTATLRGDFEKALKGPDRRGQVPPFWDGKAAERIIDALQQHA
jgi:UDP-N-acetylglucosamine 2-epimerase (non-hydrolysing)